MSVNSAIYQIFNTLNHKRYIGSTSIYRRRKNKHIWALKNGIHHCKHLQNAFNKYGVDVFSFSILEECSPEKLIQREQYWIDFVKPEYNSRLIAEANRGGKHSTEAIEKMRVARINKWASLSKEDHDLIIKKMATGVSKAVLQYNLDGELIGEHSSAKAAAIYIGKLYNSNIIACCKGKRGSAYGFIWKYKNKEEICR